MSFLVLPPEINSALMLGGAGSERLLRGRGVLERLERAVGRIGFRRSLFRGANNGVGRRLSRVFNVNPEVLFGGSGYQNVGSAISGLLNLGNASLRHRQHRQPGPELLRQDLSNDRRVQMQ
ncbi:hypothetical protein [Mycobacterium kansasii]|uniref:hypothetical protein n=1 Tax=Mycobacterium kansasii TaxID=1768 RepID=UPI0011584A5D|nr:hypothetical protein [Mycobacterium kansasii]